MKTKASLPLIVLVLALVLAPAASAQQAQGTTMSVSLDDCIVRALRDNLGVAIQVLGPQISVEAVNQAES